MHGDLEWLGQTDNPYLLGPYAPIGEELTVADLEVAGEIPRDLHGVYVRNGPNPRFAPRGRHHWFDGDGMLHAVHLEDGRATYRNRWVRTGALAREDAAGEAVWSGIMESIASNPTDAPYKDTANTDVLYHQGVLVALWYVTGAPHRVDPVTLETLGTTDYGRGRPLRVSAHAKVDPRTGELFFFDYGFRPPFMRYGVVGADGRLAHHVPIELPGPRLPHDMAITERFAVLMDLPVVFSPEALARGRWKSVFAPDLPARFGVIERRGAGESIRWFEASPCYLYHVDNAWEEGDEVVLVGCRVADPIPEPDPADGKYAVMLANLRVRARLHRWRFNLATGTVQEEPLDDFNTDFPMIDQRRRGRRSRFAYHVHLADTRTLLFDALVRYDTDTGRRETLWLGEGRFGSESPFAPRVGGEEEDDGYLLSFVHDQREGESQLYILEARNLTAGPVARVRLPQRVPLGFHACWVPGEAFAGGR